MFKRIRQRLDGNTEQGFTLIELLVVIIIIGILLAIAVPSYLGFRGRAADSSAKANVRAALPAVEAFYADNGTYTGMTVADAPGDRPERQPGRSPGRDRDDLLHRQHRQRQHLEDLRAWRDGRGHGRLLSDDSCREEKGRGRPRPFHCP